MNLCEYIYLCVWFKTSSVGGMYLSIVVYLLVCRSRNQTLLQDFKGLLWILVLLIEKELGQSIPWQMDSHGSQPGSNNKWYQVAMNIYQRCCKFSFWIFSSYICAEQTEGAMIHTENRTFINLHKEAVLFFYFVSCGWWENSSGCLKFKDDCFFKWRPCKKCRGWEVKWAAVGNKACAIWTSL